MCVKMCSESHNMVANPEARKAAAVFCHASEVQLSAVIKDSGHVEINENHLMDLWLNPHELLYILLP